MPSPRGDSSFVGEHPDRVLIINEDAAAPNEGVGLPRAMRAFLNPDQLRYKAGAEWARLQVPGLSHEVLQWSHSASHELSFELEWDVRLAKQRIRNFAAATAKEAAAYTQARINAEHDVFRFKEFLVALTVPLERGRAPSRVSLFWPGFLQMTGVVTSVDFTFKQWAPRGPIIGFVAAVEFLELRTVFRQRNGANRFFISNEATDYGDELVSRLSGL